MRVHLIILMLYVVISSCQSNTQSFLSKIKLNDLTGEVLESNEFADKILILNLWATWCKPCIQEMPDLVAMQKDLPEDYILILASDESTEQIQQFVEKRPFDLSFVQIETSMESLGVYSLPTTLIIGKEGQLLETFVGARKWDSMEQIEKLKSHSK